MLDGFSPVLHCYETNKQWMILDNIDWVTSIVHEEEVKYLDLLKRAPSIIARYLKKKKIDPGLLTDDHFLDLRSTYGLDEDTVQHYLKSTTKKNE